MRMRSSSVTILLMTLRMRSEPPSGAKVSPVRRPLRESSWARSMLKASTRVLGSDSETLVPAYCSARPEHMSPISEWSALERLSRPTSVKPENSSPSRTIWPTVVIERSRTGRVIMPAWQNRQPRVQPSEDLHGVPLVHRLGERHQWLLRVRPGVQVHGGALVHPERHVRAVGHHPLDAPVAQVVDVVEARHVDALGAGQPQQQLVTATGAALGLPLADDRGDLQYRLLAVAEYGGVDEVGDRLRVEGGVPAGHHHRVRVVAVAGVQRDAGQVQRGEHVGVAELGGERDAEQVERADRMVRVDGELGHALGAHQRLQVGPDRVGALGQHVGLLVEYLVEDLYALVGQADLVGVRVHQHPVHGCRVPVLDDRAELAAHVLDRLADPGQQLLNLGPHAGDTHNEPGYAGGPARLAAATPGRTADTPSPTSTLPFRQKHHGRTRRIVGMRRITCVKAFLRLL